jgi:abhydrolase domain-containing protein 13
MLYIGIYQDARAALDYIFSRSDVNQQKILLFGRSLGGAVALHVASDPYYSSRVAAVVVENTFTSIPEMARALFDVSILHYLPEWCYKNKVLTHDSFIHVVCVFGCRKARD